MIKFSGAVGKSDSAIKMVINFKPFLLKKHYEAYYYGDIQKAALLKVDEQVFSSSHAYDHWQ